MIRWIGKNTQFRLCTPHTPAVEPGHYAMMSQYVPLKRDDEFVMLLTTPTILHMEESQRILA